MEPIGEIKIIPELLNLGLNHESSSSSRDDITRHVEMWSDRLENRLINWLTDMKKDQIAHNKASKRKKALYRSLFIPSAIIPLVLGILTPYIEQQYMIIVAIFLCISSILTSINGFMNYGSVHQQHLHTEYQLAKLTKKVESILSEKKKDRSQAKLVMTKVRMEMDAIGLLAPDL